MADSLSQNEIDALLTNVANEAPPAGPRERTVYELIEEFTSVQEKIWPAVSNAASECVGKEVTFSSPLVVAAKPSELYSETDGDSMIVQFSFANAPANMQVIVLPKETTASVTQFIAGTGIDENVIANVRGLLEGVVQGICIAAGAATNDQVIATDLVIRYQAAVVPDSMRTYPESVRVQVAVGGDDLSGTAIWLLDPPTVEFLLGHNPGVAPGLSPFNQLEGAAGDYFDTPGEGDDPGIERILDIPFTLDVELGRVKMLVKDVCDLGTGSIVEIERTAGEPVDVLAGGRLVARGEVVVIDDYFGVRVTEILSPADRIARLSEAC